MFTIWTDGSSTANSPYLSKISLDFYYHPVDNRDMKGKELKGWRVENGYSQSQLAAALGVITLTISRWEREDRAIPPFLDLALSALPKKGGEIRRGGRPSLEGSANVKKTEKERKVKK